MFEAKSTANAVVARLVMLALVLKMRGYASANTPAVMPGTSAEAAQLLTPVQASLYSMGGGFIHPELFFFYFFF